MTAVFTLGLITLKAHMMKLFSSPFSTSVRYPPLFVNGLMGTRKKGKDDIQDIAVRDERNILYLIAFFFRSKIRNVDTVETSITHCQTQNTAKHRHYTKNLRAKLF